MNPLALALLAGVAGAACGKLIAWLSHAIPHWMELAWHREAQEALSTGPDDSQFDPSKPRPNPSVKELIVFSFVGASLCASTWWLSQTNLLQATFFSFFLLLLVLVALIDARNYLIPDSLVYPLLWMGLLANLNGLFVPLDQAVVGVVAGYLSFWTIAKVFSLLRRKEGMGHGDFKLLAAIGAWMGWTALPWIVVCACVVGLLLSLMRAAASRGQISNPIPFGPSLAIAGASLGFIQISHLNGLSGFLKTLNLA